jgi:carbonic anhydrase
MNYKIQKTILILLIIVLVILIIVFAYMNFHEGFRPYLFRQNNALDWSYTGQKGPCHWADINPDYKTCGDKSIQSPINLNKTFLKNSNELSSINWKQDDNMLIYNNTHTVSFYPSEFGLLDNYLVFNNDKYILSEFHFHNPSEHHVENKYYDLEMHLVHTMKTENNTIKYLVIGIFFKTDEKENDFLNQFIDMLPTDFEKVEKVYVNYEKLNTNLNFSLYWKYLGSLTTPPCINNFQWFVLYYPQFISLQQLQKFQSKMPFNARNINITSPSQY